MAHILIVDDDMAMLSFLSTALERAGHTTESRNNGRDALAELKSDTYYDLLLTDIVMPGMDGVELSKEASTLFPELKIMFITGFSAEAALPKSSASFKGNIMAKPFHLNDLIARVEEILAN